MASRKRSGLGAVAASVLLAMPAYAQVAPPPPPAEEPQPEFVPPPMPAPRPAAPERPAPGRRGPTQGVTTQLPDLPYPPLWTFCGTEDPMVDGICRFEDNLHYVALRANPTVSPRMVEEIQPIIVARRARFEQLVIENLDVAMQVDAGLLQEVGISDPTALQELLELVKPLTPPSNLTQELQNRDVLTPTQARFSNKIIGEYQRAYGEYLRRVDVDSATDLFMRSMFEDSMLEAMQAYDGMLHEARANMDTILGVVPGIPAEAASELRGLAIDSIEIDPAQIPASADQLKLAWRPLSTEQKKQFLIAVREARTNAEVPPVPVIDVMHAGKRVVEAEIPKQIDVTGNFREGQERANQQKDEQGDGGDE